MRFWRSERRDRNASRSRPRVAGAVAAARQAYVASPTGLGSAAMYAGTLRHFEAVERAAASGPLAKQARRAQRGLAPELIRETVRAAHRDGRRPEEVWAEALHEWLAAQDQAPAASALTLDSRRRQLWGEIEATLHGLRAS